MPHKPGNIIVILKPSWSYVIFPKGLKPATFMYLINGMADGMRLISTICGCNA